MPDDFGSPVYEGGGGPENGAAGLSESQKAQSLIDANDPRLTSEALDDDTSQDAYAVPPPPPDGKWRAKLKAVDIKDPRDGQMKRFIAVSIPAMAQGRPFLAANVEVSLIDLGDRFNGVTMTEYWVKSLVDERKRTSQASTIATKAGAKMPQRSTDAERMRILLDTLAREPEVIVETHWEARCQGCEERAEKRGERKPKSFAMGMHRFPQTRPGVFDPFVKCPTCGSIVRAQARVGGFFSVGEARATQGLGQAQAQKGLASPAQQVPQAQR
jgi:hypothetical protein